MARYFGMSTFSFILFFGHALFSMTSDITVPFETICDKCTIQDYAWGQSALDYLKSLEQVFEDMADKKPAAFITRVTNFIKQQTTHRYFRDHTLAMGGYHFLTVADASSADKSGPSIIDIFKKNMLALLPLRAQEILQKQHTDYWNRAVNKTKPLSAATLDIVTACYAELQPVCTEYRDKIIVDRALLQTTLTKICHRYKNSDQLWEPIILSS